MHGTTNAQQINLSPNSLNLTASTLTRSTSTPPLSRPAARAFATFSIAVHAIINNQSLRHTQSPRKHFRTSAQYITHPHTETTAPENSMWDVFRKSIQTRNTSSDRGKSAKRSRSPTVKKRETLIVPSDFIEYVAKTKKCAVDRIRVPSRLLATYQTRTYELARNLIDGKPVDWWVYDETQPFCVGSFRGKEIGAIRLFVGAPAAAMALEEVIVCGAKTIFEVGFAGGLQPFLEAGSIVVVTEAVRDEGTSQHYLPTKTKTVPSERLKSKLIGQLDEEKIGYFVGSVWSTDGVYRETCSKFRKLRKAGVLCVDMETSAVFAVARYRNVEAASAQVISDILAENEWQPHFENQLVRENTDMLLKVVLKTLAGVT